MPPGDLLTTNYQYEFSGLLLGSGTQYQVKSITGWWEMPEVRTEDLELQTWHGSVPGLDLLGPRLLVVDLNVVGASQADMEQRLQALTKAFRVRDNEVPFVVRRPGLVDQQVWARPRRRSFPTDYEMAHMLGDGTVELFCPDPTKYGVALKTQNIVVAAGTGSQSGAVSNAGDFESWPKLTLAGQGTNPRISNADDANRQAKFDLVMGAGDTLVVDTHPHRRTVTLNGVDRYDVVRTDNQWWKLVAGANNITVSRTGTTGTQTLTVEWRDTWE